MVLTARLLAEENRLHNMEKNDEQVAFKTSMTKNVNKSNRNNSNSNDRKYFKCGQVGHIARQCKQNDLICNICKRRNHQTKDNYFRNKNNNDKTKNKVSFLTEHINEKKNTDSTRWILDSGASSHMVNNKNLITDLQENISEIGTAKQNQKMLLGGSGKIEMKDCTLSEVISVPELSKNLLSVNKITQNGGEVVFKKDKVQVFKNKNKIMESEKNENGIYAVKLEKENEEKALTAETENVLDWHKKLGHLAVNNLKKLQEMSDGLKLKENEFDILKNHVCEVCTKARQTRNPFTETRYRASRPLEIIHTDICGPIEPVTWDNMKYFISCLEDYTHSTSVYLLNGKFEAVEPIKDFINESEAKWNQKTGKIRYDNGKEYVNNDLKKWCKNRGTILEHTIPYTPQLNGKAERLNRTLLEKARFLK